MQQVALSPIALAARDQVLPAVRASDIDRVQRVCRELLKVNTHGLAPHAPELRACVSAVVEGVIAALRVSRSEVFEVMMHAVARFAATRPTADASTVAGIICDTAEVIEVEGAKRLDELHAAVRGAIDACDRVLGPERDEVVSMLRVSLSTFLRDQGASVEEPPKHA